MVIKDYKKYNESSKWDITDNYIVSVPSGEVIYCDLNDISVLTKLNYTYYDNSRGILSLYRFICSDFFAPKVKEYLNNKYPQKLNKFSKVDDWIDNSEKGKIAEFLMSCGLLKDQFTIYDDLSIDAKGPVDMSNKKLTKIPYRFKRCTSDFNCSNNKLTSLENSPYTVHGNFNCSFNHLTNLKDGPRLVSKVYNCSNNLIESLDGVPIRLNHFNCSHNFLSNLDGAPIVMYSFTRNNNLFP